MPNVAVFDVSGKKVGEIDLSDAVFGIEPNAVVMHEVVVRSPEARFPAAAKSPGDKKAPAMRDRVPPVLPSGLTAASCLRPSREAIVIP